MSRRPAKHNYVKAVREAFDEDALKARCEAHEQGIDNWVGTRVQVQQVAPYDYYYFQDNGADILAVAHLDTVSKASKRGCNFLDTAAGRYVASRALDDRLGAYIILDLLPKLGVTTDILLTTGEEVGRSTAAYFETDKRYKWVIEFDRGGTDVVMYHFEDKDTKALVEETGAPVGVGIFSDICDLELGCKAFNWGTGYEDYHTARSHAYLEDTYSMVAYFLDFYFTNGDTWLEHDDQDESYWQAQWGDDLEGEPDFEESRRLSYERGEWGGFQGFSHGGSSDYSGMATRKNWWEDLN